MDLLSRDGARVIGFDITFALNCHRSRCCRCSALLFVT
ncbi:MAG: hypothetical protein L0191_14785 [Acidobacteria bacterium]|nr:hypothetical protein [Acidobacteriota bacterium]